MFKIYDTTMRREGNTCSWKGSTEKLDQVQVRVSETPPENYQLLQVRLSDISKQLHVFFSDIYE